MTTYFKALFTWCSLTLICSLFVGCDSSDALLAEAQANDALEQTLEGATIKKVDHDRWKRTTLITLTDGRTIRITSKKNEHIMFVLSETAAKEE